MKKIEAFIRVSKFDDVKNTLLNIGVRGLTAYDIQGRGEQMGSVFSNEGETFIKGELIPKKKIEIFCIEDELDKIISSIMARAYTGKEGDGKIFISDVDEVIKIRTEQRSNLPS